MKLHGSKPGSDRLAALVFLSPNIIGFLIFTLLPVVGALGLSMFRWNLLTDPEFNGLAHFSRAWNDPLVRKYTFNTVFLMLGIPINIVGSLLLAVLLSRKGLRGTVFFRTIFFLPTITAGIATFVLWAWIFNPDFGLLNRALSLIGIDGPRWLIDIGWVSSDETIMIGWAKPALMIMGLWAGLGGVSMLLYLAALRTIPQELYEAADIDGAGRLSRLWHITWPMVSPTTFFITIMAIITGLQGGFEMAFIMTEGGPAGASKTLGYYIYEKGFVDFEMGYAAAISCLLFVFIFALTFVQWRVGAKVVHYE